MTGDVLPWVVCAALVALVVVLGVVWRYRAKKAREALTTSGATHEAERAALIAAHEQDSSLLRIGHERDLAAEQEQRRVAEAAAQATREQLRKGMYWEEASQQVLAELCVELGVNGALVTNVVFVPVDTTRERKFVAQIDHLLLLESGALIVEAKNWRGLVFDGVTPSSVHPSFAGLLSETDLTPPFAIQISNDSVRPKEGPVQLWWKVRVEAGYAAPATQARRQANRISEFTKQRLGFAPWFATCVFYSHPDATTHVAPQDRTANGSVTTIVGNRDNLRDVIRDGAGRPSTALTPHQLEKLIGLFSTQGAHIDRFGTYAKGQD